MSWCNIHRPHFRSFWLLRASSMVMTQNILLNTAGCLVGWWFPWHVGQPRAGQRNKAPDELLPFRYGGMKCPRPKGVFSDPGSNLPQAPPKRRGRRPWKNSPSKTPEHSGGFWFFSPHADVSQWCSTLLPMVWGKPWSSMHVWSRSSATMFTAFGLIKHRWVDFQARFGCSGRVLVENQ